MAPGVSPDVTPLVRNPRGSIKTRQQQQQEQAETDTALLFVEQGEEGLEESSSEVMPLVPMIPHISSVKKLEPRKRSTMDQYSEDTKAAKEFFKKEPCLHNHRMFDRAAKIFDSIIKARDEQIFKAKQLVKGPSLPTGSAKSRAAQQQLLLQQQQQQQQQQKQLSEASKLPTLDFKGPVEKKLTYELAFTALKYQSVFDDMLDDCAFYTVYSDLREQNSQVMVVLYDYQSRKFQPRTVFDDEEIVPLFSRIEQAILAVKTKLAASLARRRIKASAPNIEYLLPDNLRSKGNSQQQLPTYCWVNTLKISAVEMLQKVRDEGIVQLWTVPALLKDFAERSFYIDTHCHDVLVFSVDLNATLQEHQLVEQGYLVRQDKSSCLAAHSLVPLIGDEQDVVVFNPGSGLVAAHLAVMLSERRGNVIVIAYRQADDDYHKMMRNFELVGVNKRIKVIRDLPPDQIDPEDSRFRQVRACLVAANCSKSAIANIVGYIVTESENLKMMQDITAAQGAQEEYLINLTNEHSSLLRAALSKFPRVHGVVYLTRSVNEQENDLVVNRAIEWVNMTNQGKKVSAWRVIPPVVPYTAEEIDEQIGIEGKYMRFKPTTLMNGCFITCIAREPDDPSTAAKRRPKRSRIDLGAHDAGSSGSSEGDNKTKQGPAATTSGTAKGKKVLARTKSGDRNRSNNNNNNRKGRSHSYHRHHTCQVNSGKGRAASLSPPPSSARRPYKVPEYMKVVKHPTPFR